MNKKGFTLIELLVVIAIIGILSALAVVSLSGARNKANDAKVKSDLNQIATAAETSFADNSTYVTSTGANWFASTTAVLNGNPCGTYTPAGFSATVYAVYSPLCTAPSVVFCVDSTGFRGTTTSSTASDGSCL